MIILLNYYKYCSFHSYKILKGTDYRILKSFILKIYVEKTDKINRNLLF